MSQAVKIIVTIISLKCHADGEIFIYAIFQMRDNRLIEENYSNMNKLQICYPSYLDEVKACFSKNSRLCPINSINSTIKEYEEST